MTTLHDVKIEPRWFDRIQQNEKFAEVRYDDRDYQTGDRIRFWLRSVGGLDEGYVVLSLSDPRVANLQARLDYQIEACQRLERSNRGLRGANTRLKAGR